MTSKESALAWIKVWGELLQVARATKDIREYSKYYTKISAALKVLLASEVITEEEEDKLWAEALGGKE